MTTLHNGTTTDYQGEERACRDCGATYVWEAGEQQYFSDRGLAPPVRCAACRRRRRAVVHGDDGSMRRRGAL